MGLNCQLFAVLLGGLFAASAKDAGAGASPVIVHSNGVITATLTRTNSSQTPGKPSVATFDFGLPPAPPQRRWMDDEKLPVLRTQWEWRGVRYIQTVMVSRLAEGDLNPGGQMPEDAVLWVNVYGENLATEYMLATASFAIRMGGRILPLELRGNMIYAAEGATNSLVGIIDIPSSGVVCTNGMKLCFEGNIPPSNNGSMTLKLPLGKLNTPKDVERLAEMEFEDELRRVKQYWSDDRRDKKSTAPLDWAGAKP